MDATHTLTFIALGALLGAAGQGVRAAVGIKKEIADAAQQNKPVSEWFDAKELTLSFVLGAVAGIVAAIAEYSPEVVITRDILVAFLVAGYAGADFISGMMQQWLPSGKSS